MSPGIRTGWPIFSVFIGNFRVSRREGAGCPLSMHKQLPLYSANPVFLKLADIVRHIVHQFQS